MAPGHGLTCVGMNLAQTSTRHNLNFLTAHDLGTPTEFASVAPLLDAGRNRDQNHSVLLAWLSSSSPLTKRRIFSSNNVR